MFMLLLTLQCILYSLDFSAVYVCRPFASVCLLFGGGSSRYPVLTV